MSRFEPGRARKCSKPHGSGRVGSGRILIAAACGLRTAGPIFSAEIDARVRLHTRWYDG